MRYLDRYLVKDSRKILNLPEMKKREFWSKVILMLAMGGLFTACDPPHAGTDCLYPIRAGGQYGYMGPHGDVVVPAQFAYTMPFAEGLGAVNVGGTPTGRDMPTDGKWGFIDAHGAFIINPKFDPPPQAAAPYIPEALGQIRHEAYVFSEGLAPVIKDGEWVYIDSYGNIRLSKDTGMPDLSAARGFTAGLANVLINGRWGYMDKTGRLVIGPQFIYPADFHEGHALVVTDKLQWILINQYGKRILPEYRIISNFYEGKAGLMGDLKGVPENKEELLRYWFTDSLGVRIPDEPQFDAVGHFGSGLCPVLVGSEAAETTYSYPGLLKAAKRIGGKWGYIRVDGSYAFLPTFTEAKSFHYERAAVRKGQYWGYMDIYGGMLTDFEFRYASDFDSCGVARVQLGPAHNDYDGYFAYLDDSGELVWIEEKLPY